MGQQRLMKETLEAKERAMPYLSMFQNCDTRELRKRGYRRLPTIVTGAYKYIYFGHDHVVKVGQNAEAEYVRYFTIPRHIRRHLAPTLRLGEGVTIQPKGRVLATVYRHGDDAGSWTWRGQNNMDRVASRLVKVYQALRGAVCDTHWGNLATFGGRVLCIDYADYVGDRLADNDSEFASAPEYSDWVPEPTGSPNGSW